MNLVYVLVPFFKTDSHLNLVIYTLINEQQAKSMQMLNLDNDRSKEQKIIVHELTPTQLAIEIKQFNLHFMEMNSIIEEHQQMKRKIQLYETLLKDYQPPISSNVSDNLPQNQDSLIKKMKKYKQLKEENKKLKKLLQVQLQNTQKVRQQTQKTMKVLREEFDALVVQISRKEKSGSAQSPYECHSNPPQLLQSNKDNVNIKQRHSQPGGGKHISSIR